MSFARTLVIAFITCLPFAAAADDAPASDMAAVVQTRESYAREFAQTVIAILYDSKKSYSDNKSVLSNAFSASVDIDWMAKFVVARGWNNATDEQRERYTSLYRRYLTETYISTFAEDQEQRIRDIKIVSLDHDTEDFTVRTRMMLVNADQLSVKYRVHDNNGSYRVRDIVIENVSLIETHRQEFSRLASSGGLEKVIARLDEMNAKFASGDTRLTLAMK